MLKDEILSALESRRGEYCSGEALAAQFHASRAAIWKCVEQLRKAGFAIDAANNKGYMLRADSDAISEPGIRKYLTRNDFYRFEIKEETGSTNDDARERGLEGAAEGLVVIADRQTRGRGRRNRSFFSPKGTGAYMSVLLRPRGVPIAQSTRITTLAAVAVCQTVEELSGRKTEIKWVNDVLIDGKKICGILTEASMGVELGEIDRAVLGVGVNAFEPPNGFPEELREIATSVFSRSSGNERNRLIAAFLNRFADLYFAEKDDVLLSEYRARSCTVGREIVVNLPNGETREGVALAIDDAFRLEVEYADGTRALLTSGEVSARIK